MVEAPVFFEAKPCAVKQVAGRTGKLMKKIATPCSTLITQRGLPAFLSKDLLDKLPNTELLQLPLSDMVASKDVIQAASEAKKVHKIKPCENSNI